MNKKNTQRELVFLTYAMIVAIVACAIFLYGFFPMKYDGNAVATVADIPNHVGHVRIKSEKLYKPIAKNVILMVIDAIRWDFLTGATGILAMPITNSLMKNNLSCLLKVKVNPPTVTMPRIKAMMTGTVSSFLDVAFNFGSAPITSDNVLLQAKNSGHKLNFYGDEVWLKLFGNTFDRYSGTQSFFVNDFTQVDDNVTVHIAKELESKEDWTMLILHYLGLDHIGHTDGPFSPLIKKKLIEMDKIIGNIHKEMISWNYKKGSKSMFIIVGDHGMKDSGGHGGATPEETLVPFLVFGTSCSFDIQKPNLIQQVDIAPILSAILALPIPSSNVGSVPLEMLNDLSDSEKLFVLYYNLHQVLPFFNKLPGYESSQAFIYYTEAINKHIDWLTNEKSNINVQSILILYNNALQSIKDELIPSMVEYDLDTMIAAIIFLFQVLCIMETSGKYYKTATTKNTFNWIFGSIFAFLVLRFLSNFQNSSFFIPRFKNLQLTVTIVAILLSNSYLCANINFAQRFKDISIKMNFWEFIYPFAMIIYIVSLTSSSFIEEEHQTWYFFLTTFLIFILFNFGVRDNLEFSFKVVLTLIGHRILRKLNSTGNKYANLPDIANWLKNQESNAAMTIFLIFALLLLISIGCICDDEKNRKKTTIFHSALATCIYLRHAAIGSVATFPFHFQSRGIIEVRIFWTIILFYSIYWIQRLLKVADKKRFGNLLLRFVVQLWIILSAILHRPQNVILLPMQLLFNSVIHDFLRKYKIGEDDRVYIYILMGNVFYFYQGNSNSLATIDVAAGYVGLESYIFVIALIFMVINTFSGPILAYLMLIHQSTLDGEQNSYAAKMLSINKKYAIWRLLSITVYTIIITIERFHLFIWSVFSPKLLYEITNCSITYIIILSINLILIYNYKTYK